ncbi:hypothetical protein ACFOLJ_26380 [Rugamonas sp. CCM 8940]|uniref:hypothetical protein n=1 Tax=Rugamonas sp. CCM 8940 TaxID=2765359 RepID=UPI0036075604
MTTAVLNNVAENVVTLNKLKEHLLGENLANIAKADPRLATAIYGVEKSGVNFSMGMGTASEAEKLGRTWVGDGARLAKNQDYCPGCLVSADGTRIYRPPMMKDSLYAVTGMQANFVTQDVGGKLIGNAHLNIIK